MRPADTLAAEVLRHGAPLRILARGGSMLPFVRDGDVALVTPMADKSIDLGDIVCYENPPGRLFLHRVIAHDGDRIVTKGDALASAEVIDSRQVLGTVVAIERRGRITRLDGRRARWRSRGIVALRHLVPPVVTAALGIRRIARVLRRG